MIRTGKTIAFLAFVSISAPAFAHGGGGNHGMNQSMPSHVTSLSTTSNGNNKSMPQTGKVTAQQQKQIIVPILQRAAVLGSQLFSALQSGNKVLAARTVRELGALSRQLAKFGLHDFIDNDTSSIKIGFGTNGAVLLNGKPLRI